MKNFCAACLEFSEVVPHYRGRSNAPLCLSCAKASNWVTCAACREGSPRELLINGVCGCTPVVERLQDLTTTPQPVAA